MSKEGCANPGANPSKHPGTGTEEGEGWLSTAYQTKSRGNYQLKTPYPPALIRPQTVLAAAQCGLDYAAGDSARRTICGSKASV